VEPAADPSPDGEPRAPSGTSPDRHDTLVVPRDHTGALPSAWPFDWQEDTTPQNIEPVYARRRRSIGFLDHRQTTDFRIPHPLLCGSDGVITVLPDHPHEGNCHGLLTVPQPTDDDYEEFLVEWPAGSDGHRPLPEIVAYASVDGGHATVPPAQLPFLERFGDKPTTTRDKRFGVIAAWDGHQVLRDTPPGRIVVESTWHHFFKINVQELAEAAPGTPGASDWRRIQEYYRNIASWLAPIGAAEDLVVDYLVTAMHHPTVDEMFRGSQPQSFGEYLQDTLFLGPLIRQVVGGPCVIIDAVTNSFRDRFQAPMPPFWRGDEPRLTPEPGPEPWDPIEAADAALGAALIQGYLEVARRTGGGEPRPPDDDPGLRTALLTGLKEGLDLYSAAVVESAEAWSAAAKELDEGRRRHEQA
jgi:hypothetical protein